MKNNFGFIYCLTSYFNYLKKNETKDVVFFPARKKLIVSCENGRSFTIHRAASVFSSKAITNYLLAATDTPMRLIFPWWRWFSLVKIKAARLLRQSICVPVRPIRIQKINSCMISLATLGHVVQITWWASRNYFCLHGYLPCFRKETRPPEKKKKIPFTLTPLFYFCIQVSMVTLEKYRLVS